MPATFWIGLATSFLAALSISWWLVGELRTRFPHWARARRTLLAVCAIPGVIVLLILLCVIWAKASLPEAGEGNADIAIFFVAIFYGPFALATFGGGLVGAMIARHADQP
jgi:hypothetical protein